MIDFENLPPHQNKGRLNPTVREIAARTQVKPQNFVQCPLCGEPLQKQFMIDNYDVAAVDFHCGSCGKLGVIYSTGKVTLE